MYPCLFISFLLDYEWLLPEVYKSNMEENHGPILFESLRNSLEMALPNFIQVSGGLRVKIETAQLAMILFVVTANNVDLKRLLRLTYIAYFSDSFKYSGGRIN